MLSAVRSRSCGRKSVPIWTLLAQSTYKYVHLPQNPAALTLASSSSSRRACPRPTGHVRPCPQPIVACHVAPAVISTAQAHEPVKNLEAREPVSPSKRSPRGSGAAPANKKQLFSEDRAETKQVPVEEDGASSATFTIGVGLSPDQEKELVSFLRTNKEVFAWDPKDMVGVPRGIIEHHLKVCPNVCPVK